MVWQQLPDCHTVDCGSSMWGKIIILMYKLWLHSLYGLYGPRCPLSPKRPINLISLSPDRGNLAIKAPKYLKVGYQYNMIYMVNFHHKATLPIWNQVFTHEGELWDIILSPVLSFIFIWSGPPALSWLCWIQYYIELSLCYIESYYDKTFLQAIQLL